ncbi:hypothetical protein OHC33_003769 [Knufia fluminis]|uniref:Protein kinase domain-containing protein n=1 Tax=Knufia fluminis TaxID=191047 RepID=A0AAN8EJ14_9EURO|nr:hypothetical protein OHC33_003769 [Knufia fluminis]
MPSSQLVQRGLEWEYALHHPGRVRPTWTKAPCLDAIKTTIASHLRATTAEDLEATFIGEGSFNKTYKIHDTKNDELYALRIPLPVDPEHKTVAEVAAMELLKQKTTLPSPRVVAYSATVDNDIGFEWILMSFMPGVQLGTCWLRLSMDQKRYITQQLAEYQAQMFCAQFTSIGSLRKTESDNYEVGRVISMAAWWYNRVHDTTNKGPFNSFEDYIRAQTRLIANESKQCYDADMAEAEDKSEKGSDDDDDDDDESDFLIIMENLRRLEAALPKVFESLPKPTSDESSNILTTLAHTDLSPDNILIDPVTCKITGIIDWEDVNALPLGLACQFPLILLPEARPRYEEPDFDEYDSATDDEDEEQKERQMGKSYGYGVKLREYQCTQLRPYFLQEMERIYPEWVVQHHKGRELRDLEVIMNRADVYLEQRTLAAWLDCIEKGEKRTFLELDHLDQDRNEHPEYYEDEDPLFADAEQADVDDVASGSLEVPEEYSSIVPETSKDHDTARESGNVEAEDKAGSDGAIPERDESSKRTNIVEEQSGAQNQIEKARMSSIPSTSGVVTATRRLWPAIVASIVLAGLLHALRRRNTK